MDSIVKDLVKKYPNDCDLGAAIRDLINNCSNDLDEMKKYRTLKIVAVNLMEYENASENRKKEREFLEKICKKFGL